MFARASIDVTVVTLALCLASSACGAALGSPSQLQPRTVTAALRNGDVSLSYLLERPPGPGPFPAVVIGHGSGEIRKEASQVLASNLLAQGFAVLRYDKRGVGESTGTYSTVGVVNSDRMFADLSS